MHVITNPHLMPADDALSCLSNLPVAEMVTVVNELCSTSLLLSCFL